MIPVILLGECQDCVISNTLQRVLNDRCTVLSSEKFYSRNNAQVLLADLPKLQNIDAGNGLVVLKESFCSKFYPEHLLHASCIYSSHMPSAMEFVQRCGLPSVSCGGQFDTLVLSSTREQTVVTLQHDLKRWDGTQVVAGDFAVHLAQQLNAYETLACTAVMLMLGFENCLCEK